MENKETYNYQGWLNSNSFIKRALAIYGYGFVGFIIGFGAISIVLITLGFLVSFL